jgi:hypothetical protein
MDNKLNLDLIPPGLILVLAGLKPAWSPCFFRLASDLLPPESGLIKELESIRRLINRACKAYDGMMSEQDVFLGFSPSLDSFAVNFGLVSRTYLICAPKTPQLDQLLQFWDSMDSLEGQNRESRDLKLNEDMGKILGYPPWRPSRDLTNPKEGQREFQGFLTFRSSTARDVSPTESLPGLVREDPQTIESYGYLESERTIIESEMERRRVDYSGFLERIGVGKVEMDVVDLRRAPKVPDIL